MARFPLYVDMQDRSVLIVGGGAVAGRKAAVLADFGARIRIVSPVITPGLLRMADAGRLQWERRRFSMEDAAELEDVFLVICATDDHELNSAIARYCGERQIWADCADSEAVSGCLFPAIVRRGEIVIGISTSGGVPVLARHLREKIEKAVPDAYGELEAQLRREREELKQSCPDPGKRRMRLRQRVEEAARQAAEAARMEMARQAHGMGGETEKGGMGVRIGSRKSRLAMVQTEQVMAAIRQHFPEMEMTLTGYDTKGDRQLDRSLTDFGGKGAFTRDIDRALLAGEADLAVHSAKDMPLELQQGLTIGAVLKREDCRDVWVSCRDRAMAACPEGTVAGTGSRRRMLQAQEMNPGLRFSDIRGNVPTRLAKLAGGDYDGLILAAAGLKRLGYIADTDGERGSFWLDGICFFYEYLPETRFLPAAGQGIIAVETRAGDLLPVMAAIHDEAAWLMLLAERAFLSGIGGSCNEAAAVWTGIKDDRMVLKARYAVDGCTLDTVEGCRLLTGDVQQDRRLAADLGAWAAGRLLNGEVTP